MIIRIKPQVGDQNPVVGSLPKRKARMIGGPVLGNFDQFGPGVCERLVDARALVELGLPDRLSIVGSSVQSSIRTGPTEYPVAGIIEE